MCLRGHVVCYCNDSRGFVMQPFKNSKSRFKNQTQDSKPSLSLSAQNKCKFPETI